MFRLFYIFVLIILSPILTLGQVSAVKENKVEVFDINSNLSTLAWAGGINSGQFSEIDLNLDGVMDLFVFDRNGNRITTYINEGKSGQVSYQYAPEYEDKFPPDMNSWALLADYNNDGLHDIFTYNEGGIRIYKNTSTQSGGVSFALKEDPFLLTYYEKGQPQANVYTSRTDIPAIVDIDSDGDLDVLSFGVQSRTVTHFENFAIDSGTTETFRMHVNTYCWGNFKEDDLTNRVLLNQPCPRFQKVSGDKHSGSTLLAFDEDGDGDKDLLIGDISYPNMVFLENGGDQYVANMTRQDTSYPSYSNPVNLKIFPAAYHLDVNNDGKKDLITVPNTNNNIENKNGVHLYLDQGTSSPSFGLTQTDFLQKDMIEMGTGAFPTFFDYNFDGLMDLVVGNVGFFNGVQNRISKLSLYENTGTSANPIFKLVDDDYAGLSKIHLNTFVDTPTFNMVPTFADINADSFPDLLIGDYNGRVHLFLNSKKNGQSEFILKGVDYLGIDVGQDASPQFFDIDGDGLQDLLIGNQEGHIWYYHNDGSFNNPSFNLVTKELGGVKTLFFNGNWGYAQPHFFKLDGKVELICGSGVGTLFYYTDVQSNLAGNFTLVDTTFLDIDVGLNSHIASADLNGDGERELILGNNSGGLSYYVGSELTVGLKPSPKNTSMEFDFNVSKINSSTIQVNMNQKDNLDLIHLELISITGKTLYKGKFRQEHQIPVGHLSSGLYFVRLQNDSALKTKKIILE